MNNLMTLWAETFQKMYPNVKIQIEGKGSSTAPPALIAGTAQFGPMTRPMKLDRDRPVREEVRLQADADPHLVRRARRLREQGQPAREADARAGRRDLLQDAQPRRRRTSQRGATLGLTGDWASRPISLYGRNSASGTYGFFKEHALQNGDYKDTVKEQPGSASVVQGVTEDRFGIGYSGIGYKTSGRQGAAARGEGRQPTSTATLRAT